MDGLPQANGITPNEFPNRHNAPTKWPSEIHQNCHYLSTTICVTIHHYLCSSDVVDLQSAYLLVPDGIHLLFYILFHFIYYFVFLYIIIHLFNVL